jgi:hypothetical protein
MHRTIYALHAATAATVPYVLTTPWLPALQLEQQELLAPADAAIQAAMGVMARGGALPAATAAAEAAASEREEQLLSSSAPTQLDEFGRNVNLMKQREGQEVGCCWVLCRPCGLCLCVCEGVGCSCTPHAD